MLVYNKMCWAITEPQREINLVTSFLSLFLNFHSGELGTSFQGGDPLQLLCILDWGLWAQGALESRAGRRHHCHSGAPRIRAGRFTTCLCVVKTRAGK